MKMIIMNLNRNMKCGFKQVCNVVPVNITDNGLFAADDFV